jgi:hypothetical protein
MAGFIWMPPEANPTRQQTLLLVGDAKAYDRLLGILDHGWPPCHRTSVPPEIGFQCAIGIFPLRQ